MPRVRRSEEPRQIVGRDSESTLPRWSVVLRALREAAGATQAGWAARLGIGRTTLQRWETGELPPGPDAEVSLAKACAERGLFRTYYQGPLRGLTINPELIRDLLADARLHAARPRAERVARGAEVSEAPARRLPTPRTSFIGREHDLVELRALLETARLVTLTGPGGAGKTRLAIQVASMTSDAMWLVDLSAVSDPALVLRAVATVLGLREQRDEALVDVLTGALSNVRALLVLDNCEHLLAACAALVDQLLEHCPGLRVLATSRQALGVAGEMVWPVAGLEVDAEAARLFVERAAAVRPGFTLNARNQAAIVSICGRLDGLPLPIELAAARAAVLSPAQIASRLDDHLRLLRRHSVTTAPRHQTLRATLDWSHDLLSEHERIALRQLAVFAGGCTLEAAEAVLADDLDAVELLTSLVSKSLVVADPLADAARYRLLETVRQYANEKLSEAGEEDAVRDRHLNWCLELAQTAEPHLRSAHQAIWLERLENELDNVRTALGWALADDSRRETALRLAALLRWFWFTRARPSEGRGWLERGLANVGNVAPAVRARALDAAAALAHNQGDYAAAKRHQEVARGIWQAEGDQRSQAAALSTLGIIAKAQGEHERARKLLEDALHLAQQLGEPAIEATVLNNLAALAMDTSDYVRARTFLDLSLTIKRALGDAAGIATSLHNLGETAQHLGDYGAALELLSESLALFRRLEASDRIAQTLHSLGVVALRRGDLSGAEAQFLEGLQRFRQSGDGWGQALCTEALAEVAITSGQFERAARLFGTAEAWREANHAPLPPNDRAAHERAVAVVAAALGATQFAVAWAGGRSMQLDTVS